VLRARYLQSVPLNSEGSMSVALLRRKARCCGEEIKTRSPRNEGNDECNIQPTSKHDLMYVQSASQSRTVIPSIVRALLLRPEYVALAYLRYPKSICGGSRRRSKSPPVPRTLFFTLRFRQPAVTVTPSRQSMMTGSIPIAVEFTYVAAQYRRHSHCKTHQDSPVASGGLELLFSNQRKHQVALPASDAEGTPSTVGYLVKWLCENLIKDPRKEMFVLDDSV